MCRECPGWACGNGAGRVTDIGAGLDVQLGTLADFETCGDDGARCYANNRPWAISDFGSNGGTSSNTCSHSYFRFGISDHPGTRCDSGPYARADPSADTNSSPCSYSYFRSGISDHPATRCDSGAYARADPSADTNSSPCSDHNSNPNVNARCHTDPYADTNPPPVAVRTTPPPTDADA